MLANENIEICLHKKAARILHRSTQEFFKTPGFFFWLFSSEEL